MVSKGGCHLAVYSCAWLNGGIPPRDHKAALWFHLLWDGFAVHVAFSQNPAVLPRLLAAQAFCSSSVQRMGLKSLAPLLVAPPGVRQLHQEGLDCWSLICPLTQDFVPHPLATSVQQGRRKALSMLVRLRCFSFSAPPCC